MSNLSSNLELNLTQFSPILQSPLQHFNLAAKQEKINQNKGVWAYELATLGYISLRGNCDNSAFLKATNKVLGVALPSSPCSLIHTTSGTAWKSIYWLSPDEWLISCDFDKRQALQQALATALVGIHSQVVDNSGGFTNVSVQGKHADDALHHCTVYNLHMLHHGKVVGTTFGKLSVFILKQDGGYQLIFRRSFADYIWRYLERAATPYGFGISKL